ncbi:unnamed protein product [Ilex paraguariensis]|uniref:RNase H type-1 domain-containing protein n=1 Tax=Ilex paraguariensis TaxID=185542 RepID=A0ABC8UFC4_9AQUA
MEGNMEAEIRALLDGLKIYHNFGLSDYQLVTETDSQLLVDMVKGSIECNRKYRNLFYQLQHLLGSLNFEIQHIYREANSVADYLANKGVQDLSDMEINHYCRLTTCRCSPASSV